jgi:hypothetical protein
MFGQSKQAVRSRLYDVDVPVITGVSLPGEGDLVSAGRERRTDLMTGIGSQLEGDTYFSESSVSSAPIASPTARRATAPAT